MKQSKQVNSTMLRFLVCLCLALVILLAGVHPALGRGPVLRFDQISLEDGLSQSSVYAILQDRQGFLWFGTEGGLNKYDGYTFTIYKHDPEDSTSLANNVIWEMYEDRAGNLWLGTGDGLDRFDRDNEVFVHYPHDPDDPNSVAGPLVWGIQEDVQGYLWVSSSDRGLSRLDPKTGQFTRFSHDPGDPNSLASNSVKAMFVDSQENLWIGTDKGLDRYDEQTGRFLHYLRSNQSLSNTNSNLILTIYEDRDGYLWTGSNGNGLARFNPKSGSWRHYASNPSNPNSLSSNVVWAVIEDRSDRLWIGTDGGGLDYLDRDSGIFYHYIHDGADPHSLCRDSIRSLYEDRSGGFWVGTYGGGLSKSNHNTVKFDLYRQEPRLENTLSDNYIWSIQQDSGGALWLGTFQGGLNKLDRENDLVTVYRHDPEDIWSISSNDVRAVLIDRNGMVWAGTGADGLNRIEPGKNLILHLRHKANDASSLASDQIRALFEDRDGNLWVGTLADGLDRLDPADHTFHHYRSNPDDPHSLSSDRVRAIYQDRQGNLWVGTSNGLNMLDLRTNRFTQYLPDPEDSDSLSNGTIFSIYEDQDGFLWIGTFGGGLNRFDPATQTFHSYTEADGLPHNQVYSILADSQGYLWLSTNNGISRFDPVNETFRNYGIQDGLQNVEFNLGAAYKSPGGEMFFGGIDGLNGFIPEEVTDNPYIPPIVITAFQKFNKTELRDLGPDEEINLSYRENFISFEFTSLDFTAPKKNEYAYKLEGFDKDWVYAGSRRYASYTNLGGGTYTFRVRGSNSDGVWNEAGAGVRIIITPPFWQTWWFTVLVVGTLIGGTVGIFGLRARNFRIQKEKLEAQVIQRTVEIERRQQVAEALRDLINILNSKRGLDEMLDLIVTQACRLLQSDGVALYRLDEEEDGLVVQAVYGMEVELLDGLTIPTGMGGSGMAVMIREPVTLSDSSVLLNNPWPTPLQQGRLEAVTSRYHAIMSVPLALEEEVYGALTLYYKDIHMFTDEEVRLATAFADQASLAIESARLRQQAEQVAVVAERSRLARDLHDAVTQTLFSASLIAEVLPRLWERNPEEAQRRLEELRQLNRGALAEMRTLLLELRPAALVDAEMGELMRHLVDAFRGRARVQAELVIEGECQVPPDVKVALYRIAQEILNNIAKHAQASQVRMVVTGKYGGVSLCVMDDGVGFDPTENRPNHLGLGIMKERAENIGAALEIDSAPGEGARIQVDWKG